MSLTLHTPIPKKSPIPSALFVSTLFGQDLWPQTHKKITGPASPTALVHVYSAAKMLALKQEPDMFSVDDLQTKIDLEKLIRMALHQSVLAFEILAGPGFGGLDRQFIIENAFTDSLVDNIDGLLLNAEKNWERTLSEASVHFNLVLTRFALNEDIASTDVATILENCTFPGQEKIADSDFAAEENFDLFKKLSQTARSGNTSLPARPKGYDGLSDYLVKLRLEK